MFKKLNILDEKDKRLRLISKDATFPLSKEECQKYRKNLKGYNYYHRQDQKQKTKKATK